MLCAINSLSAIIIINPQKQSLSTHLVKVSCVVLIYVSNARWSSYARKYLNNPVCYSPKSYVDVSCGSTM